MLFRSKLSDSGHYSNSQAGKCSGTAKDLLTNMIKNSDNCSADWVYQQVGSGAVQTVATNAGMKGFALSTADPLYTLGESKVTANDMALFFSKIDKMMPASQKSFGMGLLGAIDSAGTPGHAGVYDSGVAQPPIYSKSGWDDEGHGHYTFNQVARITVGGGTYNVAVLVSGSTETNSENIMKTVFQKLFSGTTSAGGGGGAPGTPPPPAPGKPKILWKPIKFDQARMNEMKTYVKNNYGSFIKPATYFLNNPQVIAEHYTAGPSAISAWNTFDSNATLYGESPGTCAHFVIDTDGAIWQMVDLKYMCRRVTGLNYTAIGIEMAGTSDGQILGRPAELSSALKLTHWLACTYHIKPGNVIGHAEALSSPYHKEDLHMVQGVDMQTEVHSDWLHNDMVTFRSKLSAMGGC